MGTLLGLGFEGDRRVGGMAVLRGLSAYSHRARMVGAAQRLFRAARLPAGDLHLPGSQLHSAGSAFLRVSGESVLKRQGAKIKSHVTSGFCPLFFAHDDSIYQR